MKDIIQEYLEFECKNQILVRKMINRPIEEVEKINRYSISSVKQKIKK
jgi:hypothetical protein